MTYAWYSIVDVAAAGFPVTSRCALVVWGFSCFLIRLILLSTLRIRLQYNSRQPWRLVYLVVLLLLSLHAYRFLNTNRRQCVVENVCVWSYLIKLQSLLLSELKIAPVHCVLMKSPSIFVWCESLACPSCIEFLPYLGRRPSGSLQWKTRIACLLFEASSSWDDSTSDYWMHFTYISDVVDVLGEVLRQQYIAGSTRLHPECPWIALKYRRCSEELVFKQYWNLFFCSPPFARKLIQAWIGQYEVPANLDLNNSARSSNLTAPSSCRWTVSSCRSNLIMNFDAVKQYWRNLSGLMSIHSLPRTGIEIGDSVTTGFGRGFAFATGFPVALCSTFSREMVSDVLVTHLLIPFTIRTQETVFVSK